MGSEAPSWADQWGIGAMGGEEDDDGNKNHKPEDEKRKGSGAKGGLFKAKAAAVAGKVKTGTSSGFKWVKNLGQKKSSSSSSPK